MCTYAFSTETKLYALADLDAFWGCGMWGFFSFFHEVCFAFSIR